MPPNRTKKNRKYLNSTKNKSLDKLFAMEESVQTVITSQMNQLLKKRRNLFLRLNEGRNLLLGIAAIAGTGYGVYRLYKSPSIARKKYQLVRFLTSVVTITEAASSSAGTLMMVSDDLKAFLQSDADEIPNSLKQPMKIAQSPEFKQAITGVSSAMTAGIFQGSHQSNQEDQNSGVGERMMDKLFEPAGTGFASVIVGSFARNLVLAFLERSANNSVKRNTELNPNSRAGDSNTGPDSEFLDIICSDKCRALIGECVQRFVSTAVNVYLDKIMHINTYEEICTAVTNPAHRDQLKGFFMSVSNGAVETLVRTSHEVLTNQTLPVQGQLPAVSSSGRVAIGSSDGENSEADQIIEHTEKVFGPLIRRSLSGSQVIQLDAMDRQPIHVETNRLDCGFANHNWIDKISYTLAIPSNRRLFIDVSGRMTFEVVRSFFDFTLCKFSEFFTRTLPNASHEAVDKTLNVMRNPLNLMHLCKKSKRALMWTANQPS
ncbi:protein PHLOEM PROTEIN 2-LIKE A10 isoform X2 [Cryptomeria japonica]|uniref:protein PHLOEM PROTEIN 2-LIKE A10 isoform X2 n=1 Tax=Cryptomeria japonica TaxID=3369 RepID=UPI0027DA2792|nr:protein PHLOEM PROTEIN 2-LIKE A10 isoform X2 [Cryptomeria japonica]